MVKSQLSDGKVSLGLMCLRHYFDSNSPKVTRNICDCIVLIHNNDKNSKLNNFLLEETFFVSTVLCFFYTRQSSDLSSINLFTIFFQS